MTQSLQLTKAYKITDKLMNKKERHKAKQPNSG